MNFTQAIASCMGKYVTFNGRASRGEFWWFYLFALLLGWAASIVGEVTLGWGGGNVLQTMVNLALLLPILAVGCRRLHDTGRSGWWLLLLITVVGIIPLIIWWATPPKEEGSKYAPKNADPEPA